MENKEERDELRVDILNLFDEIREIKSRMNDIEQGLNETYFNLGMTTGKVYMLENKMGNSK